MPELSPPELEPCREDRVRALGYDPGHLTVEEQDELLEIIALCPDEALAV